MYLPKNNTIYACVNDKEVIFLEKRPDTFEKEIHTKEELRAYLLQKAFPFSLIDEYVRTYFYQDVDNQSNLPWTSKPMEKIQEERFFKQNMEAE